VVFLFGSNAKPAVSDLSISETEVSSSNIGVVCQVEIHEDAVGSVLIIEGIFFGAAILNRQAAELRNSLSVKCCQMNGHYFAAICWRFPQRLHKED
jgi:hypothetical protein